eukprot:5946096-Alexandrium_andersonii.AAC.1
MRVPAFGKRHRGLGRRWRTVRPQGRRGEGDAEVRVERAQRQVPLPFCQAHEERPANRERALDQALAHG